MFVCKFRTPSCSHYEHFHVYLAYKRQTGNVVTRQTFDRAPRLTRPPTAHMSRGGLVRRALCRMFYRVLVQKAMVAVQKVMVAVRRLVLLCHHGDISVVVSMGRMIDHELVYQWIIMFGHRMLTKYMNQLCMERCNYIY